MDQDPCGRSGEVEELALGDWEYQTQLIVLTLDIGTFDLNLDVDNQYPGMNESDSIQYVEVTPSKVYYFSNFVLFYLKMIKHFQTRRHQLHLFRKNEGLI